MIVAPIGNEVILSANEIMRDILTTPFRLIKYIYKKRMKKKLLLLIPIPIFVRM